MPKTDYQCKYKLLSYYNRQFIYSPIGFASMNLCSLSIVNVTMYGITKLKLQGYYCLQLDLACVLDSVRLHILGFIGIKAMLISFNYPSKFLHFIQDINEHVGCYLGKIGFHFSQYADFFFIKIILDKNILQVIKE